MFSKVFCAQHFCFPQKFQANLICRSQVWSWFVLSICFQWGAAIEAAATSVPPSTILFEFLLHSYNWTLKLDSSWMKLIARCTLSRFLVLWVGLYLVQSKAQKCMEGGVRSSAPGVPLCRSVGVVSHYLLMWLQPSMSRDSHSSL